MLDGFSIRNPFVFQHILDQVDAAARAIQLIAQHLICRAGRSAEAAMHTGPEDFICALGARIAQLLFAECRLHRLPHQSRIKNATGVKLASQPPRYRGEWPRLRLELA